MFNWRSPNNQQTLLRIVWGHIALIILSILVITLGQAVSILSGALLLVLSVSLSFFIFSMTRLTDVEPVETIDQAEKTEENTEPTMLRDTLTGVSGRALFIEQLDLVVSQCKRNTKTCALLTIDINRFKEVNDNLGHTMGDRLLQEACGRLKNLLREVDTMGRLGDDEFCIILNDTNKENAQIVVEKIVNNFSLPFFIDNNHLLTGVSIGVALYPEDAEYTEKLISRSNIAMNVAKEQFLHYSYYDAKNHEEQDRDISLSAELREAISSNSLALYYQPKFNIQENRVTEVEALLRWIHPEKGFIPPDRIVSSAESSGLIHPLTDWVLDTALKQQKSWRDQGIDIGVAINLSVYNLQNPQLVFFIKYLMTENETPPSKLILEVTEGAMMQNPTQAAEVLGAFDDMKVKIAIDDFGTGYSSLAYLKKLPVDELKIDKSFVLNLKDDEDDLNIVRSVIDLAHNLDLSVVAEGVENIESWEKLEHLGCNIIQGFYLSRPLPAPDFETWIQEYTDKSDELAE